MSWFYRRIDAFILTTLAAGIFVSPPTAQADDKTEWILEQRDAEGGKTRVMLTADAVHLLNLDSGYEVLAAAPTWKVMLFRRQEKIECTGDLKNFRFFSPLGALDILWNRYPNLKSIGIDKRKGLPFGLLKYMTPDHNEFWMIESKDLGRVAPEVGTILQYYYHLPFRAIPYASFYNFHATHRDKARSNWLNDDSVDFDGRKPWLATVKVQKIACNAADFQYPQGFREVKDQTKILVSKSKITNITSIVDEFDRDDRAKAASDRMARLRKMQLERMQQGGQQVPPVTH